MFLAHLLFVTFFNERGYKVQKNCIVFLKKFLSGVNESFWVLKQCIIKTLDLKDFFQNSAQRGQQVNQNYVNVFFFKKILVQGKWANLGLKILRRHNSESALTISFLILNNERGKEIHKNQVPYFRKIGHLHISKTFLKGTYFRECL